MAPSVAALMAASLAMTATVLGAPTPEGDGTFTVHQVRSPGYVPSGPEALARAYHKYGVPLPADLANAVQEYKQISKRATGSAVTTPLDDMDSAYLTPVQIGTPPQTLNLDFDTGSSDLWVFSTELDNSSITNQTVYDPDKSSTAKHLSGAEWDIEYGDGSSSSGDVYMDTVSIGGLAVTSQAVEAADTVSDQFAQQGDMDGLLGLGFSSINTVTPVKQKTFFDTAKSSLSAPVFTADLKHQQPGKYNFGYVDTKAYTGSISYTSVDSSDGFWRCSWTSYAIDGGSTTKTSISGIADTGTTLLLLPSNIVKAYYAKVKGSSNSRAAGGYIYPCSTTLPSFTFGVNGGTIVIPGSYMNYGKYKSGSCFGGLQSSSGIGINIFGDIALKAAFVIFDNGSSGPRVGWASKPTS